MSQFLASVLRCAASTVTTLVTLSYSGALKYHTTDPIRAVVRNCDYKNQKDSVMATLSHFRQIKEEELQFVNKAVSATHGQSRETRLMVPSKQAALSGVAVIGAFSWPETQDTLLVTRMFWHWSLFLSTFALISSAHQRLLRHLPRDEFDDRFDDKKIQLALNLFLQPPLHPKNPHKNPPQLPTRHSSARMIWIWQCPTMLMSYSWVFFLVGYTLHVLKPVIHPLPMESAKMVRYSETLREISA